jgi:hypothetical protein
LGEGITIGGVASLVRYDILGMQVSLRRFTRTTIVSRSIVSLLPLLACWPQFVRSSSFTTIGKCSMVRPGLGRWLAEPFAGEGVFPLFKLLWLDALRLPWGSYFGMILLLWITHVAVCLLFGWLLARFDLLLLTFGLSWTNLETLSWAMQWNAQLVSVFFLAAWHVLLGTRKLDRPAAAFFLCLLASGLCSTRGIISGLILTIFILERNKGEERLRLGVLCLAPTALLLATMWLLTPHRATRPAPRCYTAATICFRIHCSCHYQYCDGSSAPVHHLLWRAQGGGLLLGVPDGWANSPAATVDFGGLRPHCRRVAWLRPLVDEPFDYYELALPLQPAPLFRSPGRYPGLAFPWKRHAEQRDGWRGGKLRTAIERAGPAAHFDPASLTAGRAREVGTALWSSLMLCFPATDPGRWTATRGFAKPR